MTAVVVKLFFGVLIVTGLELICRDGRAVIDHVVGELRGDLPVFGSDRLLARRAASRAGHDEAAKNERQRNKVDAKAKWNHEFTRQRLWEREDALQVDAIHSNSHQERITLTGNVGFIPNAGSQASNRPAGVLAKKELLSTIAFTVPDVYPGSLKFPRAAGYSF